MIATHEYLVSNAASFVARLFAKLNKEGASLTEILEQFNATLSSETRAALDETYTNEQEATDASLIYAICESNE